MAKTKTYYANYKVDGRYIAEITASNLTDAKKKAAEAFSNADFGEAEDIDGDLLSIEDDNGNTLYEA